MRRGEMTPPNYVTYCGPVDDGLKRAKSGAYLTPANLNTMHEGDGPKMPPGMREAHHLFTLGKRICVYREPQLRMPL
jgi:hypothetical protein